jgi:8-amino-7-oxononanoate synthase
VVDEAHSFGVLGASGRGACHDAGVAAAPDLVRTVTLSKSLAGQGGAVLAAAEVTQTLADTGRATLTEKDISVASRALAVARDRCHHCRNTAQAGRNTP